MHKSYVQVSYIYIHAVYVHNCTYSLATVARMAEHRIPKQILFGRLYKARPFHGVMRWKDRVVKDMTSLIYIYIYIYIHAVPSYSIYG